MSDVNIRRDEGVLTLEIDRQSKRNSIDLPMFDLLAREFKNANADDDVRAVLLCGAGDGFCAGHDLKAFDQWPQSADDPVPRFLHALAALRKPLIIAIQGWAVGIGATALLHADWVVAAPRTSLRFPFLDLGIAPEAGSSLLLARAVGSLRARQLLLGAEPIDGETAHAWGLVTELQPSAALRAAAVHRAKLLAAKPPPMFKRVKDWLSLEGDLHARIDEEISAINQSVMERRKAGEGGT
ncbi:enoyl-CoA hydratase-related protein [Variovorax guangxiensis]|uniref:Enoyl-CoA hydratase n=1 Tax=Variovorax guangxiensis TaxID=1775474 RepID=A0A502DXH4_9BURK|nr:enoyl-CoA hydratase-related protein [Variovorax guangxiensis]TPG26523.1 enoyl-CoA hydratase [Variovorax ginsengisoli]TPG30248.1 enoyl-CoA hydratase [Variovorax guangxiensis]